MCTERDEPNELCVLRNKITLKRAANSPHSFCPSISANMAEEELTELVVDNDSGKAGFPRDDAPRAVPSDARHDGWYEPERRNFRHRKTTTESEEYIVLPKSA